MTTAYRKVFEWSQIASQNMQWLCKTWRLQWIQCYPCKIKSAQETQRSLRQFLTSRRKLGIPSPQRNLWNSLRPAKSWIGIMRDLLRTEPTQMELQNELYEEWRKPLRKYWFSQDCKKAGGQKPCSATAISKCERPTSRCADAFWTSIQFTTWRADNSLWCRCKIQSCICNRPRSSASIRHKSRSWNIYGIRFERWEKLESGDLLIVDTKDHKTMAPS